MRDVTPRIVELDSLSKAESTFLMKVKVHFINSSLQLQLIIDEKTYVQIKKIVNKNREAKYRVSLQAIYNPYQNEYVSSLTKRSSSLVESFSFSCSEQYTNVLAELKSIDDPNAIHTNSHFKYIQWLKDHETRLTVDAQDFTHDFKLRKAAPRALKPLMTLCFLIVVFFLVFNNILNINMNVASSINNDQPLIEISSEIHPSSNSVNAVENRVREEAADNVEDVFHIETEVIYGLPEGYTAITFDDGPSKYTKEIVDILEEHGVKATFFFVGSRSLKHPKIVEYVKDKKMAVGNHSYSHSSYLNLSSEQQTKDLLETNEIIGSLNGETVGTFRPPYGEFNNMTREIVREQKMKMVLWNRDPQDWARTHADEIVHYFYHTDPSGGIYLLHEKKQTVEALPRIIEYLKQHDVKIITLQ